MAWALAIALVLFSVALAGAATDASRHGGRLLAVYFASSARGDQAFTINADGSQLRRLRPCPASALSPNGALIATACGKVVVMRADGSQARVLARVPQDVHSIDWSPDSRRLVYSTAGARGGIWTIGRSGGRPRLVIRKPGVGKVFWSPRTTQVAFLREWNGAGDILTQSSEVFVVRLGGSGLRRVAIGSAEEPWSPDGRKLVYSSANTMYSFDLATRARVRLGAGFGPAWAPAGKAIVFRYTRSDYTDFVGVVRPNGTKRQLLTQGFSPVWSPDGTRIAYVGYGAALRVMRRDGSGKRQIGPSLYEGEMQQLDWSR